MHAIIIDPHARTIEAVDYSGDYHDALKIIDCDLICTLDLTREGDTLYLDDEGLFKQEQAFFSIEGYPNPLAGKALCVGSDGKGGDAPTNVTVELLRGGVRWIEPDEAVAMHNEAARAVDEYARITGANIINASGRMYIDEQGNARLG